MSLNTKELEIVANRAWEAAHLGSKILDQLSSLFASIAANTDKHASAHNLAKLGQHVASDIANSLDCDCEEINNQLHPTRKYMDIN